MKKRIIAIALVLMLAVSLLPVGALADGGIYVSVGGKDFTAIDQTIKVGGGTAKLTWEYGDKPTLTLTNVKLTSFTDLGSADGVNYYAGIAYAGSTMLDIYCTNCSITAPKHSETEIYYGVYAEGSVYVKGTLNIKNATVGVLCERTLKTEYAKLNIESIGGCAVFASAVDFYHSNVTINTVGLNAIVCDKLSSRGGGGGEDPGSLTVNLRTDPAYGYQDAIAIVCDGDQYAAFNSDLKINVDADYSGYTGAVPLLVAAVYVNNEADMYIKTDCTLNVRGSENVAVEGVVAGWLRSSGKSIIDINLTGEHLGATGIDAARYSGGGRIEIIMTGAQAGDTGIYAEKIEETQPEAKEVYIDLDCTDAMAIRLPKNKLFVKSIFGEEPLNIHIPDGGKTANITDDGETFSTVTDRNGKPANKVVMNTLAYIFNDIGDKSTDPYRKAILWAVEQGITNGFTPIEFRPSAACNRGQVVTFLWRAKGSPEPTLTENPFVDVYESSPYYKAILWAVEQGITNGFDATHFKPSNPCTRAQVVTFLWRAEGKPAPQSDNNPFKDVSAVGSTKPYYEAILWAAEQGITGGYTPTEFRPNVTCNRGQVVTFIYRDMAAESGEKIVDAKVSVGVPRNPETGDIILMKHSSIDRCVPVDVTVTYSGGNVKTISAMVCYDEYGNTLPVPENFIEVIGYGTTQDTVILLTHGNNGSMLLNFNFEDNTAKAVRADLPANYTVADRYCVYQTDEYSLYAYDMNKDIIIQIMLRPNTVCSVNDYFVSGSNVYVRENTGTDSLKLYRSELQSPAYNERGYQTYLTQIASYENVKDMSFDDTGYAIIRIENGKEVSTHYDFS